MITSRRHLQATALNRGSAGFTLIEMSVVVAIALILITLGLSALTAQSTLAAYNTTKKRQEVIADALRSYLRKNGRLPCPDAPDATIAGALNGRGDDQRSGSDITKKCSSNVGSVPYVELELPRDTTLDGWENLFTYHVAGSDETVTPCRGWTITTCVNPGNVGLLVVNDRVPATSATPVEVTATGKAVVVIVSHGRNGLGAWTSQGSRNVLPVAGTDEFANANGSNTNITYFQREFTEATIPTYGAFDDVVMFLSPNDLVGPLVKDGAFSSAEATTLKAVEKVTLQKISEFLESPTPSSVTPPPPLSPVVPAGTGLLAGTKDGWGNDLYYHRCHFPALDPNKPIKGTTPPSSSIAFKIYASKKATVTTLTLTDGDCSATPPPDEFSVTEIKVGELRYRWSRIRNEALE